MRLIFAGTPEFAAVALQALLAAGHEIALVLSQPDRPAGRGMKLQASPVKQLALQHGIPVAQPQSLKLDGKYPEEAAAAQAQILAAAADAMIVAAYGLILPQWVLDAPRLGCLNIHASLLPRWRGAAPIHRAIEAGDAQTGITIMQMDAGLDTGAMLSTALMPIAADDCTASLHDKLAEQGGALLLQTLAQITQGQISALTAQAQPAEGVTYAEKISKAEAAIDWTQDAQTLARKSRAFDPFPGCNSALLRAGKAEVVKIWRLEALDDAGQAATAGQIAAIDAGGITIACGAAGLGRVRASQLQKAGGKRLPAADFLAGFPLAVGELWQAA